MEQLPYRGRPVMEEGQSPAVVSPEEIQRLQCLLRELYRQRPSWRQHLPPQGPPQQKVIREMLFQLRDTKALHGVKALYLDDTSQMQLEFLTHLTLATRRRVERIFYHGETIDELVRHFKERLQRCPRPHLLIADGNLEMLPSLEPAKHTVYGYDVLDHLRGDLWRNGIPAIGYTSCPLNLKTQFKEAGAEGVIGKDQRGLCVVETASRLYQRGVERIRREKRREEEFILTD